MPQRLRVAVELSDILAALAHPNRIRLIEELGATEMDVGQIAERLGITQSSTSQHLAILRNHSILVTRKEGHKVFYRLKQRRLASWLIEGLVFLESTSDDYEGLREALVVAREKWLSGRKAKAVM